MPPCFSFIHLSIIAYVREQILVLTIQGVNVMRFYTAEYKNKFSLILLRTLYIPCRLLVYHIIEQKATKYEKPILVRIILNGTLN